MHEGCVQAVGGTEEGKGGTEAKSKDEMEADPTETAVGAHQGGREVPQLSVMAASSASVGHEEHVDAEDDEQYKNKQK